MRQTRLPLLLGLAILCSPAAAQPEAAAAPPPVALIEGYLCQGNHYPAAARRKETQGSVRLRFAAAPDGAIGHVVVIKSSGDTPEHKLLDRAARRHLASCALAVPAPVLEPRTHEIEIVWRLE